MLKEALPLLAEQKKHEAMNQQGLENEQSDDGPNGSKKKGSFEERLTILSIAYHNLAVELEFLNKVRCASNHRSTTRV